MARNNARAVIRALSQFTSEQISILAVDVTESLHDATPKDTGWASANWLASIDAPKVINVGAVTNPTRQDASSARSQQLSEISKLRAYRIQGGRKLFVTNNVPYVSLLNAGSSTQAPSAFVQKAIAGALNRANRRKG